MGVKGLSKFLIQFCKMETSLEFLKGKRVAIDASIFLYRFKYGTNDNHHVFLNRFVKQINNFKKYDITPIYVFDGIPPVEKGNTLKKRAEAKEKYVVIANGEICEEKTKNIMKNVINITKEDIQAVKDLLDKENVKFFHPERTEGEKFCAYLNKLNQVDAVISNDHDTIVFGCKQLVCVVNDSSYKIFNTDEILKGLGITCQQLVDICISSGTDYYPSGISMIGPKKGMKLCKERGPIESWGVETPRDMDLDIIRKLFLEDPDEPSILL